MNQSRYSALKNMGRLDRFYDVIIKQNNQLQLKKDSTSESFKSQIQQLTKQKIWEQNAIGLIQSKSYIRDKLFQAQFLVEHSLVIKKYMTTYQHLFSNNNGYKQLSKRKQQQNAKENTHLLDIRLFIEQFQYFSLSQKSQINYKCTAYPQINIFLNHIINNYDPQYSLPLIELTAEIVNIYNKYNIKKLPENQIIEKIHRIMDKQILFSFGKILFGKNQLTLNEITPDLKMFTIFFINTVIFILEQYYVNPYYQLQVKLSIKEFANYQLFLYDKSLYNLFLSERDYQDDSQSQPISRKMIKKNPQAKQ